MMRAARHEPAQEFPPRTLRWLTSRKIVTSTYSLAKAGLKKTLPAKRLNKQAVDLGHPQNEQPLNTVVIYEHTTSLTMTFEFSCLNFAMFDPPGHSETDFAAE
jgi:hypothetical protein